MTAPHPLRSDTLAALRGATKRFGPLTALDAVDLTIHRGEVLAVLGPNGAGKSSALGLLTGRLAADGGEATLFGRDPRDAVARRGIGVMLQHAALPDALRVAEHVRLQSSYYPQPLPVDETLALAGLTALAQRRYGALSGGEQRRVQFALAICGRPALLFVDEPTVGLDIEARRGFWRVLRTLRDAGTSIVLTTHYLEEADALADRIVLLSGGRVLAADTPAGIKSRAAGKEIRCRTAISAAELECWHGVERVACEGGTTTLHTSAAEALLRRLLLADPQLADVHVLPLSLEDAFLTLTASATATAAQLESA